MKKLISYLITAMMVVTMIPSIAFAGTTAEQPETVNEKVLAMKYDDHMDMSGKTIEILDAGTPDSYQVGYGIADGTKDTAVVRLDENVLVATGTGNAKVSIDGSVYDVCVTAAPISVLLLIGQSNMQGNEGNLNQSIVCEDGMVYSTYGNAGVMNPSNASNYAASALTGDKANINVNGTTEYLNTHPINMLTEYGKGKEGADSGFAYQWVKETGEKVWVINAAHGGSAIGSWQSNGTNYQEAKNLFNACMNTLKKEVAAGHFTLSHMVYYWCQGCSDRTQSAEWYEDKYMSMHYNLKNELAYDNDNTFEFGGIIPVHGGAGSDIPVGYRSGTYTESSTLPYFQNFRALEMVGPRVAQIWMANDQENSVYITCTIADDWVTMPDGTNGVAEYFASHYEGGRVDYPTQTPQTDEWRTPTTSAEVKDNIHYNQIGYNEVGIESVRNTMYILGIKESTETPKVTYYDWTGYQTVDEIDAVAQAGSESLVVPMVEPCYMSKDVTYDDGTMLNYNYYDLTEKSGHGGTLTACTGETVKVKATVDHKYYNDYWLADESYHYRECECGKRYEEAKHIAVVVPADPGDCYKPACTEGVKCSVCEEWIVEPEYAEWPTNHKWGERETVYVPAIIGQEGWKGKLCDICEAGSSQYIKIPAIKKVTMADVTYNGSVQNPNPNIVDSEGKRLKKGVDYTVVYKDDRAKKTVKPKTVGMYTAIITFKGEYRGTTKCIFDITPKVTTISKLNSPAKKQIKITWKKQTQQVTGYQIRYSTKQSMANAGTAKATSYKTTTKTIKNLKSKQKYYVQIRTYKTVNGKTYYSAWSKAKTITTK